jgi:hypothetical protein
MTKIEHSARLLSRMNAYRCGDCPPERVCAWDCIQGAGVEDIMIGAVLEQGQSWALEAGTPHREPGQEATNRALWDIFNT